MKSPFYKVLYLSKTILTHSIHQQKIKYSIPTSEFVTLNVYDVLGNEVASLVNEEKSAGV